MTLVVAEATETGPQIIADALVTFSREPRRAYKESVLKAVVVSPNIAICYSGDIGVALKGLRRFAHGLSSEAAPINDLVSILLD